MERGMWDFSQRELLQVARAAAVQLNVGWLLPALYVMRHGGASRDIAFRLRSLEQVMRRGRWALLTSLKLYEKHARLQDTLHRVPALVVERGKRARRSFATRFLNG